MNQIIIISIIGISFFSCANGMTDSNSIHHNDHLIHKAHNANMIRQINNDMIINRASKNSSMNANTPRGQSPLAQGTTYFIDRNEIQQSQFLSFPLDTFFFINKIMSYTEKEQNGTEQLQTAYKGYTVAHYDRYQFAPDNFDLAFDESDQLVLTVEHPMNGELYAYGFDKLTGKQGVNPYYTDNFDGSFTMGQALLNRSIDELRVVLTIADSIFIHDFKIEAYYTHDH